MHHKPMRVMAARDDCHFLRGEVQMDDAYLGGERAGGKSGRNLAAKVPLVAAVPADARRRYNHITPAAVEGVNSEASVKFAEENFASGTA
jgi:hypothetical protein